MKRVLSSLMLVVFLFNVGGYYVALMVLEYTTNQALIVRIDDEQIEDAETITIKIPITLPYPIQQRGYERAHGDFEYKGEYYKLVKHKLEGDILYVVCIKNHEQKQLEDTVIDYVKLTNDLPGNAKKALSFFSKLAKDFQTVDAPLHTVTTPSLIKVCFVEIEPHAESFTPGTASPPPKA